MQHNDLTSDGFMRSIVVFDDFLGLRKAEEPSKPAAGISVEWVRRMVERLARKPFEPIVWEINPKAVEFVNRLPWTTDTSVEIVTFEGRNQLTEIEALLDEAQVFYQDLYGTTLSELASECGWNTTIAHVYHADRAHWLAYGPKGKYVGA